MKKTILSLLFLFAIFTAFSAHWVEINSPVAKPAKINLVTSTVDRSIVHFSLEGFALNELQTPHGTAYSVSLGKSSPILEAGAPDLPKLTTSLIIPDVAGMSFRVVSSSYRDFEGMNIAPSKGKLMRDVDPLTVPFSYGAVYQTDNFYPGNLAGTREPYIVRDFRGQTLLVYPFQYNPVTKVLRVYYDLTVEFYKSSETGSNPLVRQGNTLKVSTEFSSLYARHFLNNGAMDYTPLNDYGRLLVICHGPFLSAIQPYIDWKNSIGFPTKLVNVATIGTTSAQIKDYIVNEYNTNGLSFVLLVGDAQQVPTNMMPITGSNDATDNAYGYIVGNDHMVDVFIGRFSAETVAHVQTQVQRTLNYEKTPTLLTDDWYKTVIGIASDQGPGDDNEYDYEHIRNQQTQLLAYTYTANPELFDGSQGGNDAPGNPTPSTVSTAVNDGGSLILYTGHGSETSWGTSGFNNNNVNSLTNMEKLPFIWSVACVNGKFQSGTCFAEAWLRASQGGQPTGAIAFLGATVNQSWNSPMEGQDEMTDILAESYSTNIKRTFAGLSMNGCMKMIESYGGDGEDMADTWTVFGDPTVMVRTATPTPITATYDPTLFVGSTTLTVACNVNGARATLSLGDTILATGLIANNTITLTFTALTTPGDTAHLVITGYNCIPHLGDLNIITPSGPYILYYGNSVNDSTGDNNHAIDYGENVYLTVAVKNLGVAATSDLNVKVTSNDPFLSITDTTEGYGAVDPNQIKSVQDGYYFQTSDQIPDGHVIPFEVTSTDGSLVWTGSFNLTAHAPIVAMGSYILKDSTANDNGRLDPGETAFLKVYIGNTGSSSAFEVTGELISAGPWVTVTPASQIYGDLTPGQSVYQFYTLTVDPQAPEGQYAPLLLGITAERNISKSVVINLMIGRMPVIVVDLDGNRNSAPEIMTSIQSLNVGAEYVTSLPDNLDQYFSAFVCLGTRPNKHILSNSQGQKLLAFLNSGGRAYMEGADTWKTDPPTPVHPSFHILGTEDGSGNLGTLQGFASTFTEGMSFAYSGDNAYIDHILNEGTAFHIFKNVTPAYNTTIAYPGDIFRTIGSSYEFGGLVDGTYPSTKKQLMSEYLTFFGIQPPALAATFVGFPNHILEEGNVAFTDFSTGGVISWAWSFEGGVPSTSAEQNPVVNYPAAGVYNVQLIVSNGITTDTLLKENYVSVDVASAIQPKVEEMTCTVYPNPSNGKITLNLNTRSSNVSIRVFNMMGNRVYELNGLPVAGKMVKTIDLEHLQQGVYILSITDDNATITRKVMIRK